MKKTSEKEVYLTIQALQRMPYYLHCLEKAEEEGIQTISATSIANELKLNDVLVRKDIAAVSSTQGKPKSGFQVEGLIRDIKEYMGYNDHKDAVIVGAGSLGRALLGSSEFEQCGLSITAAFDCRENGILIGIITTPMEEAQKVADVLVRAGVSAIWNFALLRLNVPEGVLVQNENLASSLAMLSHHINQ